jgi:small subunit ribosomal protein S18
MASKKKRRLLFKRKRTLDPSLVIDYRNPDLLRRFITDRGKIIPRRISGASARQQRAICLSVKRARYLALLPFSLAHRSERTFAAEMSNAASSSFSGGRGMGRRDHSRNRDDQAQESTPKFEKA